MKEVIAIIRINKINQTKEALLKEGFSSLHCIKVLGRGKKKVDFFPVGLIETSSDKNKAESMSEEHRLIPKRLISLIVKDEDVDKVVKTIIETNSLGNPGDGKIFILPINDAIRIRTGERNDNAI